MTEWTKKNAYQGFYFSSMLSVWFYLVLFVANVGGYDKATLSDRLSKIPDVIISSMM